MPTATFAAEPRRLTRIALSGQAAEPGVGNRPRMPQLSLHSPLGALTLSEESGAIVALDWGWGRDQTETMLLRDARKQLQSYFDGESDAFSLTVAPRGSAYQRRIWDTLCAIPYGQTRSYAELARHAGGSPRSVGGANSWNPIPIIIPCHRVVGTHGLGGYSGADGLHTKRWLLALEQRPLSPAVAEEEL